MALFKNSQFFAEEISVLQRSHSEFVTAAIERLLAQAGLKISELQHLVITNGPGSFTGIRVSVGLAKALSYSLQIPIWTTDTLTVLRNQITLDQACFVSLDAYKNLVFGAYFGAQQKRSEPQVYTFESAAELVRNESQQGSLSLIGDGSDLFQDLLVSEQKTGRVIISRVENRPRAQMLGDLFLKSALNSSEYGQTIDWKSLNPLYLRGSEAEENRKIHSSE